MKVYLVAGKRTPIGCLGGALGQLSAVQLGQAALNGLLESTGVKKELVKEVALGNVVGTGLG
jgi:acetyl-CoA C-acetyltransferase